MTGEVAIRRARSAEAGLLTAIAHEAKRHWGYPESWMAAWRDALTITPATIAARAVFVAELDDGPLGFHALSLDGRAAVLEHLWVRPGSIGRGVGRALFAHAVERATSAGAAELRIDSDPHAEGFYLRMGARRVGGIAADVCGTARTLPRLVLPLRSPAAGGEAVTRPGPPRPHVDGSPSDPAGRAHDTRRPRAAPFRTHTSPNEPMSETVNANESVNVNVARRFLAAWNAGGDAVLDELAVPELVVSYTHFPEPLRGVEAFREALRRTHEYFPDLRIEAEEVIPAGDTVVVRWVYRGTHRSGELFGVPAAGAPVEVRGITLYRIDGGRVREELGVVDNLGLMAQLRRG